MKKYKAALVIGAGAFGTSIGSVLSHNFEKVIFKVRSEDVYQGLLERENKVYLPGLILHDNIDAALTFDEVFQKVPLEDIELVVSGLPTSAIKGYCQQHRETLLKLLENDIPIVSLSKGIDPDTLELPDEMFFDQFMEHREKFCFLSGPSFAKEIVEKQITLVSMAGCSKIVLDEISGMFSTEYFMTFKTYDVKGLLLGGALKNILAIAAGIGEGLGFNHNTRAALITRGIAEMLRFGLVFNSRPETFYGLSGMGDLILTTTGNLSRNKSFGLEIAKGRKPQEIINSQRSVVEGYKTTKAAKILCEKYGIRARLFEGIYDVLYEDTSPKEVISSWMKIKPRFENF